MFANFKTLECLNRDVVNCTRCPRLVKWRHDIYERKKIKWYDYWCKPVPPMGDINAELAIIGLAPGAEGANRTGRVFTGDEAGVLLYQELYAAGFSNRANSTDRNDGLILYNSYITNAVKCVPPKNVPNQDEISECRAYLKRELKLLANLKVILCLGATAFDQYISLMKDDGVLAQCGYLKKDLKFGHGRVFDFSQANRPTVVTSFHTSGYNVKTNRISAALLKQVFDIIKDILHPQ